MRCAVKNITAIINSNPPFSLSHISFALKGGEILAVVGESGSGKTSLLNALAGFIPIQHGVVILDKETVSCASYSLPPVRRNVGYIFQDQNLLPYLSMFDNLVLGMRPQEIADRKDEISSLIRDLHLTPIKDQYPEEVSGGQQQRIALARALLNDKKLLLFDEPFSDLDKNRMVSLAQSIRDSIKKYDKIGILVTHHIDEAFLIADKIAILEEGSIKQIDTPERVYQKPCDLRIARMLGPVNIVDGVVLNKTTVTTEFGESKIMAEEKISQKGTRVHVLTRADDYMLEPRKKGESSVLQIAFLGMQKSITVLKNKKSYTVHIDHHIQLHSGDKVKLRLKNEHPYMIYTLPPRIL